jgi:hypothetical protein
VREREWAIEKETQVIKRCSTSVGRMREKETREKLEGQGEKDRQIRLKENSKRV